MSFLRGIFLFLRPKLRFEVLNLSGEFSLAGCQIGRAVQPTNAENNVQRIRVYEAPQTETNMQRCPTIYEGRCMNKQFIVARGNTKPEVPSAIRFRFGLRIFS